MAASTTRGWLLCLLHWLTSASTIRTCCSSRQRRNYSRQERHPTLKTSADSLALGVSLPDWGRPVPSRIRAQFRLVSDQPLQRTSAYRQARDRAVPEPRSVRPSASPSFALRCKSE